MNAGFHEHFPHTWNVKILTTPPMIAPARQFTYPMNIAGEEDALARGAMLLTVKPPPSPQPVGEFLAICSLGFREPSLLSGVWSCPRPDDMLAVAGGYAYLVDTANPSHCVHLPVKPMTAILAAPDDGVLLLAGFHNILAVNANGLAWESQRVSWEGVAMVEVVGGALHGTGWDMQSDKDVPFVMDLRTGKHSGGGFRR